MDRKWRENEIKEVDKENRGKWEREIKGESVGRKCREYGEREEEESREE